LVAKVSETGGLAVEGFMLGYLKAHSELPVPEVLHAADTLLLLEFVETSGGLNAGAETHAAELLAALHGIGAENFGFEGSTAIGGLPQPNPWTPRWRDFFRDQRLLYMGRLALDRGNLIGATFARLEKFCGRIEDYIEEPDKPALIHGDCWGGNVLTRDGRIAAFVDPAIYYAHPEIELAFSTLFSTFGPAFFERYRELRPIAPGFFEARRDIYNLYPLLVHSALFGGQYPDQVDRILARHA
jgi:fructosamine-3-kinase